MPSETALLPLESQLPLPSSVLHHISSSLLEYHHPFLQILPDYVLLPHKRHHTLLFVAEVRFLLLQLWLSRPIIEHWILVELERLVLDLVLEVDSVGRVRWRGYSLREKVSKRRFEGRRSVLRTAVWQLEEGERASALRNKGAAR